MTMPRTSTFARFAPAAALALTSMFLVAGCDKPQAPSGAPAAAGTNAAGTNAAATNAAATNAAPPVAEKPAPPKDEVKISKELWPNGKLKYSYEMRRGADGKWGRNGIGRAYYDTGALEREGTYRDGVRVGQWKYFKPDGTVDRIEERGQDGQGGNGGH